MSSFSGKVSNIGIPLVKKAQFVSLLPVSSPFTHYPSWLFNLVAYLVGLAFQELVGKRLFRAIERAARAGHAVFALRPEIVDTVAMPQVVVLPRLTVRGSTAAHCVLI